MAGNIGIIGRARAGKDTAGAWLVEHRGYVRVSFADPIREALLKVDPIILPEDDRMDYGAGHLRLSDVVASAGWEHAKTYPEVRPLLQNFGMAVRAIDEDFWLRTALKRVQEVNESGRSAVITDVRFPNEADSLRRAGFHLVYIDRPGVEHLDHVSEGALTADDADYVIYNSRDIDVFRANVATVANHIEDLESRRQDARSLDFF